MLSEGDSVLVKNFSAGEPWFPGVIHFKTGPSLFTVDGRRVRRHLDQLRMNTSVATIEDPSTIAEITDDFPIPVSDLPTGAAPMGCFFKHKQRTRTEMF